jgi:hypothetical protein
MRERVEVPDGRVIHEPDDLADPMQLLEFAVLANLAMTLELWDRTFELRRSAHRETFIRAATAYQYRWEGGSDPRPSWFNNAAAVAEHRLGLGHTPDS